MLHRLKKVFGEGHDYHKEEEREKEREIERQQREERLDSDDDIFQDAQQPEWQVKQGGQKEAAEEEQEVDR